MSEVRVRVIAVAGTRGSPGATFVAAALACRLAGLGAEVLAIDADAEGWSLAATLDVEPSGGEALAPSAGFGVVTAESLRSLARPVTRRLGLLEVGPGDGVDGRTLAAAARDAGFGATVCDLGHHAGPLQRQLAAAADWLLWVVQPDRLGLERADSVLAGSPYAAGSAGVVLSRLGPHTLAGADRLVSERHRLPVMARLPEDRRAAARCSAARPWDRQRPFGRPLDRLARAVHPDLRGGRGIWP